MESNKDLRANLEKAVKDYEKAFLDRMELDGYYGHWVSDDVTGVYYHESELTVSLSDMVLCVDCNISRKDFMEWYDYNSWALDMGVSTVSLRSWSMGYRGVPIDDRNALSQLREDLDNKIEEYKDLY